MLVAYTNLENILLKYTAFQIALTKLEFTTFFTSDNRIRTKYKKNRIQPSPGFGKNIIRYTERITVNKQLFWQQCWCYHGGEW